MDTDDFIIDDPSDRGPSVREKPSDSVSSLGTYGDSLIYSNVILSKAYGQRQRFVPGHIPFLFDK